MTGPEVKLRFTSRADGDLGHAGAWVEVDAVDPAVAARRAAVCPAPWSWLRQVHGARVVVVDRPGAAAGKAADAAVTNVAGAALCILTADCAPVALVGRDAEGGVVLGAVHGGWRGLRSDVIRHTVDAMRALGARDMRATIGPCIHAECYEFGADDLATMVDRFGPVAQGTTTEGRSALDVPAVVRRALAEAGVTQVDDVDVCTACSPAHFSHRARGEKERQALVLWT